MVWLCMFDSFVAPIVSRSRNLTPEAATRSPFGKEATSVGQDHSSLWDISRFRANI